MGSKHYFILDTRNAVNPFSENIRYKNDKLYYVNNFSNELIIYNFPTGNINNRITFEKKGPNGIGTIRGVYPYSMDSIFLISGTYIHQFFLSDTTGILENK